MNGVVPVPVELVANERKGRKLLVGHLHAFRVGRLVEFGPYRETGTGGGCGDELDDDLVAGEGPASPVHGDVGEQPVLDLVPLGCPGQVAHRDG